MQGLTLDEIVDTKRQPFQSRTNLCSIQQSEDITRLTHILNFNPTAIKVSSSDVQNKMTRLNTKLLPAPQFRCLSLPDNYVTIAFFNVKSIVAKLVDIHTAYIKITALKLPILSVFVRHGMAWHGMAWLSASQSSLAITDDQVVVRCDGQTGDNKGGSMIVFLFICSLVKHVYSHPIELK